MYYNMSSMRLSVPLTSMLALYLASIGTQAYGSTQGTNQCDPSVNQSCLQLSQAESKASQTPLILPDLSPTREDLNDGQTDESAKTSDSNDNDDATTTSTSTDSDDDGTTENNADDNSDNEQESGDSSDDNGKDSGDAPSMIPFP
jgi:hypothetical protein